MSMRMFVQLAIKSVFSVSSVQFVFHNLPEDISVEIENLHGLILFLKNKNAYYSVNVFKIWYQQTIEISTPQEVPCVCFWWHKVTKCQFSLNKCLSKDI